MTREQLQQEFISLRNALMVRPKGHQGVRVRNIYFDHLNDSDGLAEMKSNEELQAAINNLKNRLQGE